MKTPSDRILVTRLNFLGDVVLSLPLVDALRAGLPGAEIDYLTRDAGASLLQGDARFARVFRLRSGAGASCDTLHSNAIDGAIRNAMENSRLPGRNSP